MQMARASPRVMRIVLENVIGEGSHSKYAFSQVKLGHDADTFDPVAVKVINTRELGVDAYEAELAIIRSVPLHRNIPRLLGHFRTTRKGYLVLEYLPFPTLDGLVRMRGHFSKSEAAFILRQIVDAIIHLGESGVAHRDLKTDNTIINPDTLVVKLIDFSHASRIDSMDDMDDSFRGTPLYMSPEVLGKTGKLYSIIPADIWSAGIVFWECLIGYNPFEIARNLDELRMMQARVSELIKGVSEAPAQVLRKCLAYDSRDRPTPQEAKAMLKELFPTYQKTPFIDYERNYLQRRSLSSMYTTATTDALETMAVERHLSDR